MKTKIITMMAMLMVLLPLSFAQTQTDEICNFDYMDSCLIEMDLYESNKVYNMGGYDTLFSFYYLGWTQPSLFSHIQEQPLLLIVDGDSNGVRFLDTIYEGKELNFENPSYDTDVVVDTILYNDVDDVLYLVLVKI